MNMSNEKYMPLEIAIITAVLSVGSAIGVAVLSYKSHNADAAISILNASSKKDEVALAQRKFEDEQMTRREKIIIENVPKLLSSNDSDRRIGLAVIFTLYPNQAKDILSAVSQSEDKNSNPKLTEAIKKATDLDREVGEWIIVVSSDETIEIAKSVAQEARNQGYSPTIYQKKKDLYATTIGPYPNQVEAESAAIAVRSSLSVKSMQRADAFVRKLKSWCHDPQDRPGYKECRPPDNTSVSTP
jgi:hypothetical protein